MTRAKKNKLPISRIEKDALIGRRQLETLTFLFTTSFYPPYHLGGDAVHVHRLATELARRGHDVHVLHSHDAFRVKRSEPIPTEQAVGVVVHSIRTPFSLSAYQAYAFGGSAVVTKRFHELVEELKPDVVHHHNISLLGSRILSKHGDYLNLYTAHDYWLICPESLLLRGGSRVCGTASCFFCTLTRPRQLWRYRASFRNAINDIDVLIAPSQYCCDRMMRKLKIDTVTIPNFAPVPPTGIGSSGFSDFLLFVGVLEVHKGIVEFLQEYLDIARDVNLNLVIVGEGGKKSTIDRLVNGSKVSDRIFRLGRVGQDLLWSLLSDARALIIPSIWPENAPLVALEALSVGTPVVGSNRGGLPEIVSKLDPQLVFSLESFDIRRAIRFASENSASLRERARETYRKHFTPELYLRAYEDLLLDLFASESVELTEAADSAMIGSKYKYAKREGQD